MHDLEDADIGRHDILLVNGLPIDIPVIAGIVTTEYQTPLSHINVLSYNRGTPNMTLTDAFENQKLNELNYQLVHLKVEYEEYSIRLATIEEASAFWQAGEPADTIGLELDTLTAGLVKLDTAGLSAVKCIGGKAANFAEMLNAFKDERITPPVPENYFAIPFYYYYRHIRNHEIDTFIYYQLHKASFSQSSKVRKESLRRIRERIVSAPLDPELLALVNQQLEKNKDFTAYRFRSSTNAEDLEGFNGAGLYDSYTGKTDDEEKTVERAIKKVWASLWNYSAFEEREYFRILHETCAMGILVHRSFPDEDANGVIITRNQYNTNPAFIINVQYGENSIVAPEPGIIHDQVIQYIFNISGNTPFTYEYISNSNILPPGREHVLNEAELNLLGSYVYLIKEYFYTKVYPCSCDFKDYGLDLEFKIDSELVNRKLYLKQVRPF